MIIEIYDALIDTKYIQSISEISKKIDNIIPDDIRIFYIFKVYLSGQIIIIHSEDKEELTEKRNRLISHWIKLTKPTKI